MVARMRVVFTALALMAFAFVLNLMGDLTAASSTGPILRGTTSVRVAIEPAAAQVEQAAAPIGRPALRGAQRMKDIPRAAPARIASVEKPAKVARGKSAAPTVLARALPEAAKLASAPPKTMTAKASGWVNFERV